MSDEQNSAAAEIGEVTRFLHEWAAGNKTALAEMMEKTINKLKSTARQEYARTRGQGADRPTELVGYVWERLSRLERVPEFSDSKRFYAYCARIIRNLLIDRIRATRAVVVSLDEFVDLSFLRDGGVSAEEFVSALDLLDRLEKELPAQYEVFYYKKILGFKDLETADILDISVATVQSRCAMANAWLYQEANKPRRQSGGRGDS
jgi:RNA polymerase sigma factor (TIGR02999 family)